jgi:PTS system fructose-specific IIC component
MKISDYLKQDEIITKLTASSKDEAIKELARALEHEPKVTDLDLFINDTFEREGFCTTGIGRSVAIPHARTEAVSGIVIALGRSVEGIDFDSLDGKPVHLVFLMGTPKRKNLSNYLSVLARLTRLLEKESFRKMLLEADTKAEIIDAFRKVEE